MNKKVIVIGAGIGGLCAGIYLSKNGYDVELLEQHSIAGGLCTAWKREGYTFETCIDWFTGSRKGSSLYDLWTEIFDVAKLELIDLPSLSVIEDQNGNKITVWNSADKLERELLEKAPEDIVEIKKIIKMIRKFSHWEMPSPSDSKLLLIKKLLKALPLLPSLMKYSKLTGNDYSQRWKNKLARHVFAGGTGDLSMLALIFALGWMDNKEGAYPIGGSLNFIKIIQDSYLSLGGAIRFKTKVKKILIKNDRAIGVILENEEEMEADHVISAADGHETIFELLNGKYVDAKTDNAYKNFKTFPSYLQISLGVNREFSEEPPRINIILDSQIELDPETEIDSVSTRIFNYDPTMAPKGKTSLVSFLPTFNYEYWEKLRQEDSSKYNSEKGRIAKEVINILGHRFPGLKDAVEVIDVSTPATIIRYTGNWKGSMEGWMIHPKNPIGTMKSTLPGLENFYMVGQWVSPGGGLPSGPVTARPVAQAICRKDGLKFRPR